MYVLAFQIKNIAMGMEGSVVKWADCTKDSWYLEHDTVLHWCEHEVESSGTVLHWCEHEVESSGTVLHWCEHEVESSGTVLHWCEHEVESSGRTVGCKSADVAEINTWSNTDGCCLY